MKAIEYEHLLIFFKLCYCHFISSIIRPTLNQFLLFLIIFAQTHQTAKFLQPVINKKFVTTALLLFVMATKDVFIVFLLVVNALVPPFFFCFFIYLFFVSVCLFFPLELRLTKSNLQMK